MESEFNKANKIVTNRRLTIKIKNVNLFIFFLIILKNFSSWRKIRKKWILKILKEWKISIIGINDIYIYLLVDYRKLSL